MLYIDGNLANMCNNLNKTFNYQTTQKSAAGIDDFNTLFDRLGKGDILRKWETSMGINPLAWFETLADVARQKRALGSRRA